MEADEEGGYRSPDKTNQIPMPALQSSVLSKRFSLSSGPNRSRMTKGECSRKKPIPTQSRRNSRCNEVPQCKTKKVLTVIRKVPQFKTKKALTVMREVPQCKTNNPLTSMNK
jgi:hypothetical protein